MKKLFFLFFFFVYGIQNIEAQIYKAKDGGTQISFFSQAPLENIEAVNKGAIIVLNSATNDIQIRVTIQNFKFKNSLMEEHFNENYMETEKFPTAVFKGKINEAIDYNKEGEQKVSVTGKMEIHGVTRDITIGGTLTKNGSEIAIASKFKVKVADYNIKVPSMYVKNIAEEVEVTVNSVLEPFQKK